jgi:hypothetical protein
MKGKKRIILSKELILMIVFVIFSYTFPRISYAWGSSSFKVETNVIIIEQPLGTPDPVANNFVNIGFGYIFGDGDYRFSTITEPISGGIHTYVDAFGIALDSVPSYGYVYSRAAGDIIINNTLEYPAVYGININGFYDIEALAGWPGGSASTPINYSVKLDGEYLLNVHRYVSASGVQYTFGFDSYDFTVYRELAPGMHTIVVDPVGEVVPEPNTVMLIGVGIIGMGYAKRRKAQSVA